MTPDRPSHFKCYSRFMRVPIRDLRNDTRAVIEAVERGVDFVPGWLNDSTDSLLATSPDLAAVAEQLDSVEGLTAFAISMEDFSIDAAFEDAALLELTVVDRPFSAQGRGWSGIGESARFVLVYAFADEQAAADAAPSVEATFAPDTVVWTPVGEDPLTMRSILNFESIETVGRTVVVTTSFPDAAERPSAGADAIPPYLFHE